MTWLSVLVGVATGVISGCGIGGGTLLVLYLTAVVGMEQYQAGGVNLLYFLACAAPALVSHARQGRVAWRGVVWCLVPGIPAAIAAGAVAGGLDVGLLRRLFGVLMLYVGIKEVLARKPRGKAEGRDS